MLVELKAYRKQSFRRDALPCTGETVIQPRNRADILVHLVHAELASYGLMCLIYPAIQSTRAIGDAHSLEPELNLRKPERFGSVARLMRQMPGEAR